MKEHVLDAFQAAAYISAAAWAWFDPTGAWWVAVLVGLILSTFEDQHKFLKVVEVGLAAVSMKVADPNWAWVLPAFLFVWNIIDLIHAIKEWFKNPQFFPAAEGG